MCVQTRHVKLLRTYFILSKDHFMQICKIYLNYTINPLSLLNNENTFSAINNRNMQVSKLIVLPSIFVCPYRIFSVTLVHRNVSNTRLSVNRSERDLHARLVQQYQNRSNQGTANSRANRAFARYYSRIVQWSGTCFQWSA